MLEGPGGQDREFADLAKSTFDMWQRLRYPTCAVDRTDADLWRMMVARA
jgi:hypothetical protein